MSEKPKPKEKLTKLRGARFEPATVDRMRAVAESLEWTESQVLRWCVRHSLPKAEELRLGPFTT